MIKDGTSQAGVNQPTTELLYGCFRVAQGRREHEENHGGTALSWCYIDVLDPFLGQRGEQHHATQFAQALGHPGAPEPRSDDVHALTIAEDRIG